MAMAASLGIKSWIEGGIIGAVILLNVVVGFYQEYAAEKTMESLQGLSSPTGTVTRDGHTSSIPAADIVPGDIVELKTGDTVPVDLRYALEAVPFSLAMVQTLILLDLSRPSISKRMRHFSPVNLCLSKKNTIRPSKRILVPATV
jgi:hypothetical protein